MTTILYVMLLGGLAFVISGTGVSHMAVGQTWARGWPLLVFGIAILMLGLWMAITSLNWALGL